MDTQELLEKNIGQLFGLEELPEKEKGAMLDEIGSVVMESALLQLVSGLTEERAQELEALIEKSTEPKELLETFVSTFPEFEDLLTEEMVAFKEEAVAILKE